MSNRPPPPDGPKPTDDSGSAPSRRIGLPKRLVGRRRCLIRRNLIEPNPIEPAPLYRLSFLVGQTTKSGLRSTLENAQAPRLKIDLNLVAWLAKEALAPNLKNVGSGRDRELRWLLPGCLADPFAVAIEPIATEHVSVARAETSQADDGGPRNHSLIMTDCSQNRL
jgi:hypothetical protein